MTCLWTRSGRCRNNPLKMAYNLWALCKVSALVGTLKTVSEVFSICSSSASKPLSAKISQALKENAKSRQQFWSSSEVGYPKNSGHLTTFEASEKLLRFFASDTSFIVRAASAADWAALAAFVINSTSASGAAAAMLEASSTKQWRHYGASKGARPVWNPSLLRIGSSPREGLCPALCRALTTALGSWIPGLRYHDSFPGSKTPARTSVIHAIHGTPHQWVVTLIRTVGFSCSGGFVYISIWYLYGEILIKESPMAHGRIFPLTCDLVITSQI